MVFILPNQNVSISKFDCITFAARLLLKTCPGAANPTKTAPGAFRKKLHLMYRNMTVWKALKEDGNIRYEKTEITPNQKLKHQLRRADFADLHQTWNKE